MKRFVAPDASGMRDYLDVYVEHEPKVFAHLLDVCRQTPALAALLQTLSPQELETQRQLSIQRLRTAVLEGAWEPMFAEQRRQGALYANLGVPFTDWYELIGA